MLHICNFRVQFLRPVLPVPDEGHSGSSWSSPGGGPSSHAALQRLQVLHVPADVLLVLVDVVEEVGEEHGEPEEHGDQHHHISGSPHRQTQVPVLHQDYQWNPNSPWRQKHRC